MSKSMYAKRITSAVLYSMFWRFRSFVRPKSFALATSIFCQSVSDYSAFAIRSRFTCPERTG